MKKLLLLLLLIANTAGAYDPTPRADDKYTPAWCENQVAAYAPTADCDVANSRYEDAPLVHYLAEDAAASTVVVDKSGNYNGTSTRNTADFSTASGKISRGFDFYTGSSADDIDLGSDVIGARSSFSFCLWLTWDSRGVGDQGRLLDGASTYNIRVVGDKLTVLDVATANDYFATGVWKHFCFVRSGSSTDLYLNGEFAETLAATATNAIGRYIGNRADGNRSHDGKMDDIRIYNRALSAREIVDIYNEGSGHQLSGFSSRGKAVVINSNQQAVAWQCGVGVDNRENIWPHNSEEVNAWSKARATVDSNSAINPIDGATTADTLIEADDNNTHYASSSAIVVTSGVSYRFSIFAKKKERHITLRADMNPGTDAWLHADLDDCSIHSVSSGTGVASTLVNGWCRYELTFTASATSDVYPSVYTASVPGTYSYDGDVTTENGVYIWGGQFSRASADRTYIIRTGSNVVARDATSIEFSQTTLGYRPVLSGADSRENRLLQSENLQTTWSFPRAVALSATEFREDSTASNSHYAQQALNVVAGQTYRYEAQFKRGTGSRNVQFIVSHTSNAPAITLDLSDGSTLASANWTPTVATVGDYYRVSGTYTAAATETVYVRAFMADGSSTGYNGDGSSSIHFTKTVVQLASADPTYTATTTYPIYRGMAGRRTLVFDGVDDHFTTTKTVANLFTDSGKTLFAALRQNTYGAIQTIIGDNAVDDWNLESNAASPARFRVLNRDAGGADTITGAAISAVANTPYILSASHDGTNVYLRVNNALDNSGASGATNKTDRPIQISGYGAATGRHLNGPLSRLTTFNKVLPLSAQSDISKCYGRQVGANF